MNKIFFGLILSASMLTTSCDMDTVNHGVLDQDSAIESVADARSFLNGCYVSMRAKGAGTYITWPDVQADYFVGLVDNGNRLGPWSAGQIVSSDTDWADNFNSLYNTINYVNYFLPAVDKLIDDGELTEDDLAKLDYYKGSAKFIRAYAYWYLFDKLVWYKTSDLETPGKGLQIETQYHPSANRATYVGRSTIKETVEYINTQLSEAFIAVSNYETNYSQEFVGPNAARVNSYAVAALQARMALLTQDYATALAKAEYVINSTKFPLVGTDKYASMWLNDEGSELIFVPYAEVGFGGYGTGLNYYRNNKEEESDYIPTAEWLMAYDDDDCRFDAFFTPYNPLKVNGENYVAFAFTKFPGNPALRTSPDKNNNLNKAKPFRSSELYLIAAEAAVSGANKNEAKANTYLNTLRKARIDGYSETNYSGNALVNAIREERGKELIGEGFRLSDLRRWGQGFTRTDGFSTLGGSLAAIASVIAPTSNNLTYSATDYRFVWPIPFREMQVNPQLKGQQNERY